MIGRPRRIRIVGLPGAGKTYLRGRLARELGIPSADIADQPGHPRRPAAAWAALGRTLERLPTAIVESAGVLPAERTGFVFASCLTVVVEAPLELRQERLAGRVQAAADPTYVERLAGYEDLPIVELGPRVEYRGDADFPAVVAACREFLGAP